LNKIVILSLSLLLLILIPGCFTFQVPSTNPIPPVGTPPVIIAFSNNPATINAGGTSTLLWNVTGATSVSIDNGIGQVDVAGTRVVSPAKSTVYTISATNSNGTVIKSSAIIIVSAPAQPPTTTIDPNVPIYSVPVQQGKVTQPGDYPVINFTGQYLGGTSFQLNWNVINATQIVIVPEIGQVQPTGSRIVNVPSGQSKTYRLTANNDVGSNYWQVIVASPQP
jgi:hypothetical protein